jgi:hypothetical protein
MEGLSELKHKSCIKETGIQSLNKGTVLLIM